MAKSTCVFALFVTVLVCAEAIRIDTVEPEPERRGKFFPSVKKNDPRCKRHRNEKFVDPKDCTKYVKCVRGDSRLMKCPETMKFDSRRGCVFPDNHPDCGKRRHNSPLDADEVCPSNYGQFPVKSDCHKYMICSDNEPHIRTCPKNMHYNDVTGSCADGDKCPSHSEEANVCKRANELIPDKNNCLRYIKCVNFQPMRKECPPETAFEPQGHRCTKKQFEVCRNNSILEIAQEE